MRMATSLVLPIPKVIPISTSTMNYDRLNRLVETLFSDGSKKEFAYDQLGNLTKAVNSTVEERYHYDELSRLVKTETIGSIDPENKLWTIVPRGRTEMFLITNMKLFILIMRK